MVKDTMKRKKPSFNEAYHGYRTFSELLEDAAREGLLELDTDKRSRTYVVTRFGSEMTAEAAAESGEVKKKKSRRRRGTRKKQPQPAAGEPAATEPAGPEEPELFDRAADDPQDNGFGAGIDLDAAPPSRTNHENPTDESPI
jgi:hypothetical protein